MSFINTFFEGIAHLLYPQTCYGCGSDAIQGGHLICLECKSELAYTGFHHHTANPVEKVFRGRLPVESATSFLYFTKGSLIQTLMHQLKYRGRRELGVYLGKMMGHEYSGADMFRSVDLLIPLPLHWKKEKVRGFNQAAAIAEGMAAIINKPVLERALVRRSSTLSQTKMNRTERWENMKDRFDVAQTEQLAGRHVLLLDDVITTGATLEASGTALLQVEGLRLSVCSLAYTSSS